jgi:hypothetical protein
VSAEGQSRPAQGRIETLTALLIAVITVTTAAVVWRASMLGSEATGVERGGMIDTLKSQAAAAENLAYLYQQEADLATGHVLFEAQIAYVRRRAEQFAAMEGGSVVAAVLNSEAEALLLADQGTVAQTPLVADDRYRRQDGGFDLEARFRDLEAEHPDLAALDPGRDFARADALNDKALYLELTVIAFAAAISGLTLAQITQRRIRWLFLVLGVVLALLALAGAAGLELFFSQVA